MWNPTAKCDNCYAFKEYRWIFPFDYGWVIIYVWRNRSAVHWRNRKSGAPKEEKKVYCPTCAKKLGFDKL